MNAPHQLNGSLTFMPITDSSYSWQEKMCRIGNPGRKYKEFLRFYSLKKLSEASPPS